MIEDQFGDDHGERRQFFTDVLASHRSWIKSRSMLSGNNLLACFFIIEDLMLTSKRKRLMINFDEAKMIPLGEELSGYRGMTFEQKTDYARRVHALVVEFLGALSQATFQE